MSVLENIKSNIFRFTPNQKTFMVIGLSLLFIGISVYVYKTFIQPKLNPNFVANKEFVSSEGEEKEAEILMFNTEWCPHCKKAKPHWEQFKEKYDGKVLNNHRVVCKEYDCDKNEKMCDEYKIDGYPTIKMLKDGQTIDFDAKPTIENLTSFVESTL
tara:strand:+ start:2018 stop:2488 length:471 start_codon:yes stop_codon:yes gene_type:complete